MIIFPIIFSLAIFMLLYNFLARRRYEYLSPAEIIAISLYNKFRDFASSFSVRLFSRIEQQMLDEMNRKPFDEVERRLFIALFLFVILTWKVNMFLGILGIVVGWFIGRTIFFNEYKSKIAAFTHALPDICEYLGILFSAGEAPQQALTDMTYFIDEPVRSKFQRVNAEIAAGIDPQYALEKLSKEIKSPKFVAIINRMISAFDIKKPDPWSFKALASTMQGIREAAIIAKTKKVPLYLTFSMMFSLLEIVVVIGGPFFSWVGKIMQM